jgi:hypothetical protein
MPMERERNGRLRKVLSLAYTEREGDTTPDLRPEKVMQRIRLGTLPAPRGAYLEDLERFLWRLVPVSLVLLFLLGILFGAVGFSAKGDSEGSLVEDPAELSMLSLGR